MSSISSLSSSTGYVPAASSQNNGAQRRADFQQIVQDLQNNDLSGAQQAYSALQQTGVDTSTTASVSGTSGTSSASNSSPLDALGQALQNNDLSGAQQALAKLKQAHHGGGHHHHGGAAPRTGHCEHVLSGREQFAGGRSERRGSADWLDHQYAGLICAGRAWSLEVLAMTGREARGMVSCAAQSTPWMKLLSTT